MPRIYDKQNPPPAGNFPSVLAIGDSWFWYPASNLFDQIDAHPSVSGGVGNTKYTGIYRLGFNGAASIEYVGAGRYAPDFNAELLPQNIKYYSGFFISGGGNDAVAYPDLHNGPYTFGLKDQCGGIGDPLQCLDEDRVQILLRQVIGALGHAISNIVHAYQASVDGGHRNDNGIDIFLHGYAYPVPDGRGVGFDGFPPLSGPWIGKKMDLANVDKGLPFRYAITRELITRLNKSLSTFDGMYNGCVHFIDSEAAFGSNFDPNYKSVWTNELHPTPGGFKYIVDQYWVPMMKRYGFAV